MLELLAIFVLISFIVSQSLYVKFKLSAEGLDERGQQIVLKTESMLYNSTFFFIVIIISLSMLDLIADSIFPMILLFGVAIIRASGTIISHFKNK